jgi:hypothetical protein
VHEAPAVREIGEQGLSFVGGNKTDEFPSSHDVLVAKISAEKLQKKDIRTRVLIPYSTICRTDLLKETRRD